MGFRLRGLFRRSAQHAILFRSNASLAAAQFACYVVPAEFFLFTVPASSGLDDPVERVLIAPRLEVNLDGLWLLGGDEQ